MELAELAQLESHGERSDLRRILSDHRPARGPQHGDREATPCQILLIAQILVGSYEKLEPSRFGFSNVRAVLELCPSALDRRLNPVVAEGEAQGNWCPLVEQDSQMTSDRNSQALARMLENRVDLFACHTRKPLEELQD